MDTIHTTPSQSGGRKLGIVGTIFGILVLVGMVGGMLLWLRINWVMNKLPKFGVIYKVEMVGKSGLTLKAARLPGQKSDHIAIVDPSDKEFFEGYADQLKLGRYCVFWYEGSDGNALSMRSTASLPLAKEWAAHGVPTDRDDFKEWLENAFAYNRKNKQ